MKHNYLKHSCLAFTLLFSSLTSHAQDFIWAKGSNAIDQQGTYGTQGTAAQANTPGAREGMVTWTDANGIFWLFGGYGLDGSSALAGQLSDLWKYNPVTNEWTWVKGSALTNQYGVYGTMGTAAAANMPGGRGFSSAWADPFGNLWLFGGRGFSSGGGIGELNDLWRYNIANNQWTWMKGSNGTAQTGVYGTQGLGSPTVTPGGRYGAAAWTDNAGNLWLFGGAGYGSSAFGDLSDLWRYNPVNDVWAWVKGTGLANQYGSYGTMGVAALSNNPGGRSYPSTWKDSNGNLWMFGGLGRANTGPQDALGDLWQYDIVSNHWTWIKGYNNVSVQAGVYGTQNTYAPGNLPGSRYGGLTWRDGNGDFWLFGGLGFDGSLVQDHLNDIWRYEPSSNQWKWVKGSAIAGQPGLYGTQGVPSPIAMPGSRFLGGTWMDSSNNLYLFGGQGIDGNNNTSDLNDLWKMMNCIGPTITVNSSHPSHVCVGTTATLTVIGASTYTWNFAQTISPTLAVSPFGTSSYSVYGMDLYGCRDTAEYIQTVVPVPQLTIQYVSPEVCPDQPAIIGVIGANTYTWSTQSNQTVITVTPNVTTSYTVSGTDQNGCEASTIATQSVGCVGINGLPYETEEVRVFPNPASGRFVVRTVGGESSEFVLMNAIGQQVLQLVLSGEENEIKTDLPAGVYYYRLNRNGQLAGTGKLVIE